MKLKHWYAVYGTDVEDMPRLAQAISHIFESEISERRSSYIGDYSKITINMSKDRIPSEIKIRKNIDLEFGGLEEPDYPQFKLLIYISRIADLNYLEEKLKNFNLHRISLREI